MALSTLLLAAVAFVSPQAPPEPMAVQPAAEQTAPAAVPTATEPAEGPIDAGLQAYKRRHFAKAEDWFRQAVDADPGSAAAHFYLGYTIYKRTEPKRPFHPDKQKAAEQFARAYEIDPGFQPRWRK